MDPSGGTRQPASGLAVPTTDLPILLSDLSTVKRQEPISDVGSNIVSAVTYLSCGITHAIVTKRL